MGESLLDLVRQERERRSGGGARRCVVFWQALDRAEALVQGLDQSDAAIEARWAEQIEAGRRDGSIGPRTEIVKVYVPTYSPPRATGTTH